jgi:hypothetical protein
MARGMPHVADERSFDHDEDQLQKGRHDRRRRYGAAVKQSRVPPRVRLDERRCGEGAEDGLAWLPEEALVVVETAHRSTSRRSARATFSG